ncbi:hypothetical protein BJY01DRAFT_258003 [Aspergillus pseudoustus]|uniref:Transferase family-domain-containing protein n=1 Tax=Aspergillus pseudoustus TaxID=1810923 RepID=A0ABR4JET5_9EURO
MAPSEQKYSSRSSIALPMQVRVGLVVDDVLDASVLRSKYAQLIELWPVLGGKLLSMCGSTVDFECRKVTEDLASYLPFSWSGSTSPSVLLEDSFGVDRKFEFSVASTSRTISKLRVTTLNDATLLWFSVCHGLCDGAGAYDIVRYFSDLLSNRPIPKFVLPPDATGGRMSDLVQDNREKQAAETLVRETLNPETFVSSHLTALKFNWKFTMDMLLSSLGLAPKLTDRLVYLPGPWVDEVRARAQKELQCSSSEFQGLQLTRNDIIAGLYLKLVYGARRTSNKPVDYIGPINYRGLLEALEPDTYYAHNSVILLLCLFSEHELQTHSIAIVAARIRLATMQYRQPAVIKHELRLLEDKALAPAMRDIRGSIKWGSAMVSPWTTFDYMSLDFSGAARKGQRPSVVFVNANVSLNFASFPSPFAITVKDGAGGYWFRGANTRSGWEDFELLTSMDSLFCP